MFVKTIKKIHKEDYHKLSQCSKQEALEIITDIVNSSPFPVPGYGMNHPRFYEENGEYFISWERYDSCD